MIRRRRRFVGAVRGIASLVVVAVLAGELSPATSALADPAANLRDALASARSGTSCAPLRYNPVVAQVAQIVNRSTDTHLTRPQRESRSLTPLEGLKDLGCGDTTWLR